MTPCLTIRPAAVIRSALTALLVLAHTPAPASAQGNTVDGGTGARLGPLGVRPRIGWQTGYEDNVFRSADRPESDLVSILSARTDVRVQMRRVGLSGYTAAEWVHFDRLVDQRGANLGGGVRLDFDFNRIVPYVSSSYRNSRQRLNPEIDTRPRTEQSTVVVGSLFRIGARTAVDVSVGRAREAYDRNARANGVNLGAALNRESDHVTLSFRRELTPFTRISVTGEMDQERFRTSATRSADNVRFSVGYDSDGRINGTARAGVRILTPHDGRPESRGLFFAVGTSGTVRDRLRIGVDAERDLAPSYWPDVPYYGSYYYGVSLAYAVGRTVRLSTNLGRRLADYELDGGGAGVPVRREGVDRGVRLGSGISYRLGDSMEFDISGDYTKRRSVDISRRFDGVSLRAGVNYAF